MNAVNAAVQSPSKTQQGALGLLGLGALLALFAVGYDQGQIMSISMGDLSYQMNVVHEFFHDARHAIGLACH